MCGNANIATGALFSGRRGTDLTTDGGIQGFLLLTKARMLLPPHTLSEVSYHEEIEASSVVTVDCDGKWRLQDASEAKRQKADEKRRGATLVHRRKAGPSNGEAKRDGAASSKSTGVDSDTLLWFSSLPPSDLREAKKQFSSGELVFRGSDMHLIVTSPCVTILTRAICHAHL